MYGFSKLSEHLKTTHPKRLIVIGAADEDGLMAVTRAQSHGFVEPVLVGDRKLIAQIAEQHSLDISQCEIVDAESMEAAALIAMEQIRDKKADAIMKGRISTKELMQVGLRNGLRNGDALLSHIAVNEHLGTGKSMLLSDAGLVPYPNLQQRVQIIRNAVHAARSIGISEPKVALLSSSEEVDEKIPCSMDAVQLVEMNQPGGQLADCGIIAGPMDLGAAIDSRAAEIKGVDSPVAGEADILHCPDVVAGNLIGKTLIYFAGPINVGGCIVGGKVPVIMLSRASTADDKYHSIVVGLACAD